MNKSEWIRLDRVRNYSIWYTNNYNYNSSDKTIEISQESYKNGEQPIKFFILVYNHLTQESWIACFSESHFGSTFRSFLIWLKKKVLCSYVNNCIFFNDLNTGKSINNIVFNEDFYIDDILLHNQHDILVLSTSQSLYAYNGPNDLRWKLLDISIDGIQFIDYTNETITVQCFDPPEDISLCIIDILRGKIL